MPAISEGGAEPAKPGDGELPKGWAGKDDSEYSYASSSEGKETAKASGRDTPPAAEPEEAESTTEKGTMPKKEGNPQTREPASSDEPFEEVIL